MAFASFESSVVNQVVSLFDQHSEHILGSFILEGDVCVGGLLPCKLGLLLVIQFRLRSVGLIRAVRVLETLVYDTVSMVSRVRTLKRSVISTCARSVRAGNLSIVELSEDRITRRFPFNVELLTVYHLISLNDLLNDGFSFLFVHLPDLADPVIVALFKSLVLLLQLFEHLSEVLKFFSALNVLPLEFSKLFLVLAFDFSYDVLETSLSQSK